MNSKSTTLTVVSLLTCLVFFNLFPAAGAYSEEVSHSPALHTINLSKWGIHNDGTRPVETTRGINNALSWAHANGITAATLPSGTYLIDKNSTIHMVSDMHFELTSDTVLQKDTNGFEKYSLMYIGHGVKNVVLKGGTYKGDKDTHDYSKKDNPYSSGTHEGGYGISTEGASNIVIDGVKAMNFTGDGLNLSGYGSMITDLYESSFVSGTINETGQLINNANKIRLKKSIKVNHPLLKQKKYFELSNPINVQKGFEIYFYKADGKFLKKIYAQMRNNISIPEGASHFNIVISKNSTKGVYLEVWNRTATTNVTVNNSEFAFNRRQGITVGGADNVLITNNLIHDMKGTAPQAGIDIEGGFEVNGYYNSNISITNNRFYNNTAYDVIAFDGKGAVIENNYLGSKNAIGLAVSNPFSDATIINNHFDGTRIFAENDAVFIGNKMNDSNAYLEGPNISMNGMEFTDSSLTVSAKEAFGVSLSNITMYNNKKSESGLSLWRAPIKITNMTISGESKLRAITGNSKGNIITGLKVIGFNSTYGLSLPGGTYTGCNFEAADGSKFGMVGTETDGDYVFDGCTFTSNSLGAGMLHGEQKNMNMTVRNSSFLMKGSAKSAIDIQAARKVLLENNKITGNLDSAEFVQMIKINDYWKRNENVDVLTVKMIGNEINSNLLVIGISTQYAGKQAAPYTIESNRLSKATLELKPNDIAKHNTLE